MNLLGVPSMTYDGSRLVFNSAVVDAGTGFFEALPGTSWRKHSLAGDRTVANGVDMVLGEDGLRGYVAERPL